MRPAAQERWLVCYDLEGCVLAVAGYSELILESENREKVPELAKKVCENAERALKLVQVLRFSGILEGEKPPEISQGKGWPEISTSLRAASSARSPDDLKKAQDKNPHR